MNAELARLSRRCCCKAAGMTLWLCWLAHAGRRRRRHRWWRCCALRASAPLRLAALLYTEFLRSVPILIVMFFCYFGVPLVFGIDVSPFTAATVALALHASSTMSEVVRAGIESVGRGQWEAAQAAGHDAVPGDALRGRAAGDPGGPAALASACSSPR